MSTTNFVNGTQIQADWMNDVDSTVYSQLNVLRYIPKAIQTNILNYTSTDDVTTYLQTAITAASGKSLYLPAGKYNYSSTLMIPKTNYMAITGEQRSSNSVGTLLNYTGTGTGMQIGVDDGNPNSSGKTPNVTLYNIAITTANGTTGLLVQGAGICHIEKCTFGLFKGKVIDLHACVLIVLRDNEIYGSGVVTDGSNIGIALDDEYFGNYIVDIQRNHFSLLNWGIKTGQGRRHRFEYNTFEGITGWVPGGGSNDTLGGLIQFAHTGTIGSLCINNNYCETTRGYFYYNNSMTGKILSFVSRANEYYGSQNASFQNPAVGNLPRDLIYNSHIEENFLLDVIWDVQAGLGLAANTWINSYAVYDPNTTIDPGMVTGKEYEDTLAYRFKQTELLRSAGDFATVNSGTPGSMTITGGALPGWAMEAGKTVDLVASNVQGTFCIHKTGGVGVTDLAHVTATIPLTTTTTYWLLAFTHKDWVKLKINGNLVYNSGSALTNWTSATATVSLASGITGVTIELTANDSTDLSIAELRLWQIGSADFANPGPGNLNGALINAALRNLKRGIY
jgi:hypothetical protein